MNEQTLNTIESADKKTVVKTIESQKVVEKKIISTQPKPIQNQQKIDVIKDTILTPTSVQNEEVKIEIEEKIQDLIDSRTLNLEYRDLKRQLEGIVKKAKKIIKMKMTMLYDMLHASAVADRKKALLSLDLLANHSVGIGDHSTTDFYNNAEEALQKLVDADDRIETLEKYWGNKSKEQING